MANLITRKQMLAKVGYSKNHVDREVQKGKFPAPLKPFGPYGRALWLEDEVEAWIASHRERRDAALLRRGLNAGVAPRL